VNNPNSLSGSSHQRGVGSVEITTRILEAMLQSTGGQALRDIAQRASLSAARVHPYLVSLIKAGMVEQDAAGSQYRLGHLALRLGLACLQSMDPVRIALPLTAQLAHRLGHSVALAVWRNAQAIIIHVEEAQTPIRVTLRHGSVMSLTQTATGLLFAAQLSEKELDAALALDSDSLSLQERLPVGFLARPNVSRQDLTQKLAEIRRAGVAQVRDTAVRGLGALSTPIFDHSGKMVLALTSIGLSDTLNTDVSGTAALSMIETAAKISEQLGRAT
jgi:DNA-binding IclR family transcriptional regulator